MDIESKAFTINGRCTYHYVIKADEYCSIKLVQYRIENLSLKKLFKRRRLENICEENVGNVSSVIKVINLFE
jgi:hypothetical protein